MQAPRATIVAGAVVGVAIAVVALAPGCSESRTSANPAPTFDENVVSLLAARCEKCHGASAPAERWRFGTYFEAIGCVGDRGSATAGGDAAPILRALDDATHQGVVSAGERETIATWIRAGAPKRRATVHDPSFADPRSDKNHARLLRAQRWRPMLDATDDNACGRCHEGAPARPAKVTTAAPGATPCTTCHTAPEGPLACTTCHGNGTRHYPPRDACFHPEDLALGSAHAAHVEPRPTHAEGLACSTCHPAPAQGPGVISGSHGNGVVDVVFDPNVAGGAQYDTQTRACTSACHAHPGGARPKPAWTDTTPMKCGDCHSSPPPDHYAGACTDCHREANADGTALTAPHLHANGKVDLGDGSGGCGACHGAGDDPWPTTGAHASHKAPKDAAAVPCETCHTVPTGVGRTAGHPRGGPAIVKLAGRSIFKGADATYSSQDHTCSEVYCHGARIMGTPRPDKPSWFDKSGAAKKCGACHTTPPGDPHIQSTACNICHGGVVIVTDQGPIIAPSGAARHVNGVLDRK